MGFQFDADGADSKVLKGGTDETLIGNVDDKLKTTEALEGAAVYASITVGTSVVEAKVGASALANRKLLTVFNNGNQTIYWGYDSSVTSSTGTPIFKSQFVEFEFTEDVSVWLISDTAGQDVRVGEIA